MESRSNTKWGGIKERKRVPPELTKGQNSFQRIRIHKKSNGCKAGEETGNKRV